MWVSAKLSIRRFVWFIILLSVTVLLTVYSGGISTGVKQGMALCVELLIPSLFVFLCFSQWLCLTEGAVMISEFLSPLFRLLFGKFWQGGMPFLLCLLGGYPMGVSSLMILEEKGKISRQQAERLSFWIFCPSPAFAMIGVGLGMFGSLWIGFVLWFGCVFSCLLTGIVFCRVPLNHSDHTYHEIKKEQTGDSFVMAITLAIEKMLLICGTVIVVGGMLGFLEMLPFPAILKTAFHMFLEVTNGCVYLSKNGGSLAQIGAVLMFGGISSHFQCKMLLGNRPFHYRKFYICRIIQTILCYSLLTAFSILFPEAIATISLGGPPVMGTMSILPSVGLLATCLIFLCTIYQKPQFRRECYEKPRICS